MCSGDFSLFDVDDTPESLAVFSVSETINELKSVLEGYAFSISVISLEGKIDFISSFSFSHDESMDSKGYKVAANRLDSSVDQSAFTECMLRHGLVNNRFKIFFDYMYSGYISYVFALKDGIANRVWSYIEVVVEMAGDKRANLVGIDGYFSLLGGCFSKACKSLWDLQAAVYFCNKSQAGLKGKQYILYALDGEPLYWTKRIPLLLAMHNLSSEVTKGLKVFNSSDVDKKSILRRLDEKFNNEWVFSLDILGGPDIICVNVPEK